MKQHIGTDGASITGHNYPKSYASIKPGNFRLHDSIAKNGEDLEQVSYQLHEFCDERAKNTAPAKVYGNLLYIGSGWEWSVFQKDESTVIKIPAGIFPEVNDEQYLENSQEAYEMVMKYYPNECIAQTKFQRSGDENRIEQEFIESSYGETLPFTERNAELLAYIKKILVASLQMLEELQWMPDLWLQKNEEGFELNNLIIQKGTNIPKIIDVTFYFDPFRMYPQKTEKEVALSKQNIQEFLGWIATSMIQ